MFKLLLFVKNFICMIELLVLLVCVVILMVELVRIIWFVVGLVNVMIGGVE